MIPAQYRLSGIESPSLAGYDRMKHAWATDEFVRDPSRLTLYIGLTGIDGDTFRHSYLMDKYGIQVNKTSRNTVLFMTNIGTTRSSVAHLIEVLVTLAHRTGRGTRPARPARRPRPATTHRGAHRRPAPASGLQSVRRSVPPPPGQPGRRSAGSLLPGLPDGGV